MINDTDLRIELNIPGCAPLKLEFNKLKIMNQTDKILQIEGIGINGP